jgi:uncharacterized protein YdaU (DUF1376 family)
MKFYKHDPNAFLAGTGQLSLEERGAYITLIDMLYANDDLLVDNDEAIARAMNCQTRRWQRIKSRLMKLGKIRVDNDGLLHANRVTETILEANKFSFTQRSRVNKRWFNHQKAKENNADAIRDRITSNTHTHNKTSTNVEVQQKEVDENSGENSKAEIPQSTPSNPEKLPHPLSATDELRANIERKWLGR